MATRKSETDNTTAAIARSLRLDDQAPSTTRPILYKELSYAVTGAAIAVHRHLGPGQLESTYERALAKELEYLGIPHRCQVPITASYRGDPVGEFYADVIVDQKIILELKSVERVAAVHRQQVLSYLRATGLRLGMIMNFNSTILFRAITRVVR